MELMFFTDSCQSVLHFPKAFPLISSNVPCLNL